MVCKRRYGSYLPVAMDDKKGLYKRPLYLDYKDESMLRIISILILLYSPAIFADKFGSNANYKVCFTPSEACTDLIVTAINQAKSEVLVQAYSFTSMPIAKALAQAHKRGVAVKVILDKSQYRQGGFSSAKMFNDYHIPLWIDYRPTIAHNKVMVIDNNQVITGSFNFTRAAQEKNAENVLLISDSVLAKKYKNNWQERLQESETFDQY